MIKARRIVISAVLGNVRNDRKRAIKKGSSSDLSVSVFAFTSAHLCTSSFSLFHFFINFFFSLDEETPSFFSSHSPFGRGIGRLKRYHSFETH